MGTTVGVWACASESSTAHWVKQNVHCWLAGSVSPDGSSSCVVLCKYRRLLHLILEFEAAGSFLKGSRWMRCPWRLGQWDRRDCLREVCEAVRGPCSGGPLIEPICFEMLKSRPAPCLLKLWVSLSHSFFYGFLYFTQAFLFLRLIYACSRTLHLLRF